MMSLYETQMFVFFARRLFINGSLTKKAIFVPLQEKETKDPEGEI